MNGDIVKELLGKKYKRHEIPRNELSDKERNHPEENKLTFNMTYYPTVQNTKIILEKLQILLAPNKDHRKCFLMFLL